MNLTSKYQLTELLEKATIGEIPIVQKEWNR